MNNQRNNLTLQQRLPLGRLSVIGGMVIGALAFSMTALAATVTDLRADSAKLDGKTGEYFYRGNAMLSQENIRISADEIEATQNENGSLKSGRFRGEPAILEHLDPISGAKSEARAREIIYDTASGRIELLGGAQLTQADPKLNRQMRLEGERIELVETGEQLNDLAATGSPVLFSRQEENALPIEGQANQLRYQGATEHLVLEGDAKLQQGPTKFEHIIIEYDGKRKSISAPKRDGQQVKITRVQEAAAGTEKKDERTNKENTVKKDPL